MADSGRKSRLNKDTVGDNQTIFDFLKRKKQVCLQHTVNKSLHQHSSTKQKNEIDVEEGLPQTKDLSKYYTHDMSNKYARTAKPKSITPHKIQFQDRQRASDNIQARIQKEHEYGQPKIVTSNPGEQANRRGKSFLSMISPVKARASSALQECHQEKENQNKNVNKSEPKGNKSDNYVRRNLTKSIGAVKDTINQLSRNINTIKEKSHGLAVLLNPIFNYLAQGNHPVTRQVGDLRNKFKSFESLIDGVSSQTCDQQLQQFHRTLEQHLQTIESEIRRQAARSKNQEVLQLKNQKQLLIQKLQSQLKKVLKDNELLIRKIEKTENSKGEIQYAVTQREINYVQQLERMKNHYEASIEQLQTKNQDLQAKLKSSFQQIKFLEKEHKNEKMFKQSLQSKFREEIQQISEAKDAYLLNQIMVLKAEFNADLTRLNQLHKIKEDELQSRIQKKEQQIQQKMFENGCNKQIQVKIMEEANAIKQQNLQLKTQADCIIADMYRMNEQLYQHWIALKDIKVLSTRLGSFAQYRQIYLDLAFNDHLFH